MSTSNQPTNPTSRECFDISSTDSPMSVEFPVDVPLDKGSSEPTDNRQESFSWKVELVYHDRLQS